MLISCEGIDGSGKNTQVNKLCRRLELLLYRPISTYDFPHYLTPTGELIKRLLKEEIQIDKSIKPLILQSLMTTNRNEYYSSLKEFSGSATRHIVLDRYYVSGIVYGQADGLDKQYLIDIHESLPRADITFLIDITAEESHRRRPDRRDEYETRNGFLHKVRDLYLDWFIEQSQLSDNGWWRIVDGSRDVKSINDELFTIVKEYSEQVDLR